MERCIGDHRRVIFFSLRCCFICYGIIDLLFCIVAAHDGTDCRPCKCVMDALYRCQAYTERRTFFIKKSSTCKSLHNCDSHIIFLACFVQAGTVCIDSLQTAVKLFCKHGINVLTCRKHVKSRIDAEKDHLHIAGFCRFLRHFRIMGAHTDMTDHTCSLQFHYVIHIFRLLKIIPFFLRIYVMDHSKINIIRLESF